LIHWPDVDTPIEEAARALNDLIKDGKTRYVGVSNFSADQLRGIREHAPVVANQVGYNLFDRRWERQMFPTALDLGVGVMSYGPMAHGLLTGAFTRDTRFVEWDWRSHGSAFGQALFAPENFPRNVEVADQLKSVAARLGTTLPKLAIAWVLEHPAVAVALSGTRRSDEIEHNVGAVETRFSRDDLDEIDRIMRGAAGQVEAIPT